MDKETKFIMETDEPGKIQQKLNTWKKDYNIVIIALSAPALVDGRLISTMLVERSPKLKV